MRTYVSAGPVATGQRDNTFKVKEGRFRLDTRKKFFTMKVLNHWKRFSRRGSRCPIPGNIQGQVGRGSAQHDLVKGVPAHCRGLLLDDL